MPPTSLKHRFYNKKGVANSPLLGIEYGSPDWEPVVVTTTALVYISLLILLCADIQIQVLK